MKLSIYKLIIVLSLLSFYFYRPIDLYLGTEGSPPGISIQLILLIPLAISGILGISVITRKQFLYSPFLFFILYIVWILSVTLIFHRETIRVALAYIAQFLVLSGAIHISRSKDSLLTTKYIKQAGILAGIMFLFYTFYQFLSGNIETTYGLEGDERININHIASTEFTMYVGSIYFLIIFAVTATVKIRHKIGLGILACSLLYLVLLSGATAPILTALFLTAFYFFMLKKGGLKALIVSIILGTFLLSFFSIALYDRLSTKYDTLSAKVSGIFEGDENNVRSKLYKHEIEIIKANPLSGIGLDTYRYEDAQHPLGIVTHNNLLGIAVGSGIPASVFYFLFFIGMFVKLFKSITSENNYIIKSLYLAILCILAYQQIRGLVQDTWALKEIPFWLGIFYGLNNNRVKSGAFNRMVEIKAA